MVGVSCSREIEVSYNQEERGACDEYIVVVLAICKHSGQSDNGGSQPTSLMVAKAVGPASVIATFTMKCDADARPMTFERKVIGTTSAPYL